MASITIPTAVSIAQRTLGEYIYNEDDTSIQALFNDDTNWTAHDGCLYYGSVPVLTYFTVNTYQFACRCNQHSTGGVLTVKAYDLGSTIYIYDFDTFTVFCGYSDYSDYKSTSYTNTTSSACVVVDKTNQEVVEAWINSSTLMKAGGSCITLDSDSTPVYAEVAITDAGGSYNHAEGDVVRTVSLSDAVYYTEYTSNGDELTRFVLLTQFPTESVFTTLHIGENYYFVLPYPERTYQTAGSDETTEIWCAMAIDVTDEVS